MFPHCKPLPGVVKLIKHLKACGVPIAVATSSHTAAFKLKTQNHDDLFSLFDGNILCGDDPRVKNGSSLNNIGKPAPDIFVEAAKMLGNDDVTTCLVFEDALSGVMAGLNAGMNVVWVPDVQLELDLGVKERCSEVLVSIEDFQPEKYGIAPYN